MTDIVRERRLLRGQGLEIRTRDQWGARCIYTDARAVDEPAVMFFLHIAVVNDPGDLVGTEDQVARNVEAIGKSRFPNTFMSYNALAFNSGRLYEGQPLTRRGAHTVNDFERPTCNVHGGTLTAPSWNLNVNARALCLPQQVDDEVTDEQIDAAARWAAAQIRAGLAIRGARWHGHRCVSAKACPGDKAFARIAELQALTEHYVKHGLVANGEFSAVTLNIRSALPVWIAARQVRKMLRTLKPDLVGFQEIGGEKRAAAMRDVLNEEGYGLRRPNDTPDPVGYRRARFRAEERYLRQLTEKTRVGSEGAGPSVQNGKDVTVAIYEDKATGGTVAHLNAHLTASIQLGGIREQLHERSVERIALAVAEVLADHPGAVVVVTGDFNTEDRGRLEAITELGVRWGAEVDTFSRRGIDYVGARGAVPTGRSVLKLRWLDHRALLRRFRTAPKEN